MNCYKKRIFLQCRDDTVTELIDSRHFVFEGDSRIGDVRSIDFEQPLCFLCLSCSDYCLSIFISPNMPKSILVRPSRSCKV